MDSAHRSSNTHQSDPLITVIVPVFNEAPTVNQVIARLVAQPFRKEVIVVDDGSTDQTLAALTEWERDADVRVISHSFNRGKGAAIRTAISAALGTYTLIQDADLEYAPEELPRIIAPLTSGEAEIVYGSRYMDASVRHPSFISHYGVKLLNRLILALYQVRLSDHATCYKAFRTDLLRRMDLQCERFEFCTEVTAKACRMRVPIKEVPISYVPRSYSQGKKIGPLDGVRAGLSLIRHRFWLETTTSITGLTVPLRSEVPMVSNL